MKLIKNSIYIIILLHSNIDAKGGKAAPNKPAPGNKPAPTKQQVPAKKGTYTSILTQIRKNPPKIFNKQGMVENSFMQYINSFDISNEAKIALFEAGLDLHAPFSGNMDTDPLLIGNIFSSLNDFAGMINNQNQPAPEPAPNQPGPNPQQQFTPEQQEANDLVHRYSKGLANLKSQEAADIIFGIARKLISTYPSITIDHQNEIVSIILDAITYNQNTKYTVDQATDVIHVIGLYWAQLTQIRKEGLEQQERIVANEIVALRSQEIDKILYKSMYNADQMKNVAISLIEKYPGLKTKGYQHTFDLLIDSIETKFGVMDNQKKQQAYATIRDNWTNIIR